MQLHTTGATEISSHKDNKINRIDPDFDFDKINITINADDIKVDAENNLKQSSNIGLFTVLKGNEWLEQANKRPIPNPLFNCLWYEGEICILFADTNLGKSILAVQIATDLSAKYNVFYTTSSSTIGVELTGSGVNDVTIDVPQGSSVTTAAAAVRRTSPGSSTGRCSSSSIFWDGAVSKRPARSR